MLYLALLRGINVGGKNKVEMARLRETFERVGASHVTTYINTGNVVFRDDRSAEDLVSVLEEAIEEDFGFRAKVLVRAAGDITATARAVPADWVNDSSMKCDVIFLWDGVDRRAILDELIVKPEIDDVVYVPGAIIWRVDRDNLTRSGMMRLATNDLYGKMTIRNVNTVRKLAELAADADG